MRYLPKILDLVEHCKGTQPSVGTYPNDALEGPSSGPVRHGVPRRLPLGIRELVTRPGDRLRLGVAGAAAATRRRRDSLGRGSSVVAAVHP